MYSDFPELLIFSKRDMVFSFIQVDTNGLCLRKPHYQSLLRGCDLLGVPLDGGTREMNDRLRGREGHFMIVLGLLEDLGQLHLPLKVNTVVCRENIRDLLNLEIILGKYPIKLWSLYEFWGIGPAADHVARFSIPTADFLDAVQAIAARARSLNVEIGAVSERRQSYFFVSHSGRAYTVDRTDSSKYFSLGSVFDADILEKWQTNVEATADPRLARRVASVR
jgi:MoaA/NifB/PqqE/SkfB family radical SAM enzyme